MRIATVFPNPVVEWESQSQIVKLSIVIACAVLMYEIVNAVLDRFRNR